MLNLEKIYDTDEDLEESGKWFPIGSGIELKIARQGNRKYNRKLAKMVEERRVESVDLKTQDYEEILLDLMAETILLDWRGVKDLDTGKAVAYTKEKGREILEARKDLRKFVDDQSGSMANYRRRSLEAAEKN